MTSHILFPELFKPIRIGAMEVRNRIVMPPMATNFATRDGYVTEQMKDYYEARARGGAGLVIVEIACVEHPLGSATSRQLCIDDDSYIPGLKELAAAIKKHGARAAIQLNHAGGAARSSLTGMQTVAPSPISRTGGGIPEELSVSKIEEIVGHFARATERAQRAGFDAVELHAAHYYLISQFLSAAWNQRQDAYGGNLENRARFLLDIVRAIRSTVGRDFPLWCRINGREYNIENGTTIEEAQTLSQMLERAGCDAVDVSACALVPIHASAWVVEGRPLPPMAHPPGLLIPLAQAIKKVVHIPVIAVGNITPQAGEQALKESHTDMIAIGKALIADPELPNKVTEGRLEDIAHCINCLRCRDRLLEESMSIHCSVNAAVGKEKQYEIKPAPKRRKVIVVGGGAAGMEAARIAALRGHKVWLYEKENRLGGQLNLASVPPYKERINLFTRYLTTQVSKLGVKVELDKEATPEIVGQLQPDVLVLATGATPIVPDIPGLEKLKVVTAEEVLSGKAEVGKRVVVIGGELVGCEVAEYLAEKRKRVTIARRGPELALKVGSALRALLLNRLTALGVTLRPGVKYEEVTAKGLVITNPQGKPELIEADTLVLAAGSTPNTALFQAMEGKAPEIHIAGDCVEPRGILEAVADGARIGREI